MPWAFRPRLEGLPLYFITAVEGVSFSYMRLIRRILILLLVLDTLGPLPTAHHSLRAYSVEHICWTTQALAVTDGWERVSAISHHGWFARRWLELRLRMLPTSVF